MGLPPLPHSVFDKPRSLTASVLAWLGMVGGAIGCIDIILGFLPPAPLPALATLVGSPPP